MHSSQWTVSNPAKLLTLFWMRELLPSLVSVHFRLGWNENKTQMREVITCRWSSILIWTSETITQLFPRKMELSEKREEVTLATRSPGRACGARRVTGAARDGRVSKMMKEQEVNPSRFSVTSISSRWVSPGVSETWLSEYKWSAWIAKGTKDQRKGNYIQEIVFIKSIIILEIRSSLCSSSMATCSQLFFPKNWIVCSWRRTMHFRCRGGRLRMQARVLGTDGLTVDSELETLLLDREPSGMHLTTLRWVRMQVLDSDLVTSH